MSTFPDIYFFKKLLKFRKINQYFSKYLNSFVRFVMKIEMKKIADFLLFEFSVIDFDLRLKKRKKIPNEKYSVL